MSPERIALGLLIVSQAGMWVRSVLAQRALDRKQDAVTKRRFDTLDEAVANTSRVQDEALKELLAGTEQFCRLLERQHIEVMQVLEGVSRRRQRKPRTPKQEATNGTGDADGVIT